jgi:hypothetical protein
VTRWARTAPLAAFAAAALALAGTPAASANNTMYVNARDDRPSEVSPDRLYEVASTSARRWSLRVARNTTAPPGVRDGTQSFGFSEATNPKALGVTSVWTRARYRVVKVRVCGRVNGRRVCKTIKRTTKLGNEVVEKDVQLNPFVTWEEGPAYPARDEYDLESTVLHELGHFAHPLKDNHVHGCENSPMIDSISPGEFWRDADDWLRFGCSRSTGAQKLRPALPGGPALDMQVVEHRLPGVIER